LPKTVTDPAVGSSRLPMSLRKVDLPHPDEPISVTNSPGWTVRSTPDRA